MRAHGTMAERALDADAGATVVRDVDLVYSHDATTPLAMSAFKGLFTDRVAIPAKTAVVFDHAYPPPTVDLANLQRRIAQFVEAQGIAHFHRGEGVCHQLLLEKGWAAPGRIIVGADSHTTTLGAAGAFATGMGATDVAVVWATGKTWLQVPDTLRVDLAGALAPGVSVKDVILALLGKLGSDGGASLAMEYGGPGLRGLPFPQRITLANMAAELEAATGMLEVDAAAQAWLEPRVGAPVPAFGPSADASYTAQVDLDLASIEPNVARPPRVDDVVPVGMVQGIPVDKVFIGTCTNGRYEDLAEAAALLRGRKAKVPLLVVPASQAVMDQAAATGVLQALAQAGATIGGTGCGPCLGRQQGVLADEEVCFSTSSRNYSGRMGSPNAKIYLGSPLTAAATALEGRITDPRPLLRQRTAEVVA
jgi:3-isopropylmalate dehydratase large subunit